MRPILRGAKITIFLLGATLVSSFIVLQSPRPTHAEGLLYKVGCVVRGVLSSECPGKTAPAQPAPTPPSEAPASTLAAEDSSSTSSASVVAPQPLVVDTELFSRLPTIAPLADVSSLSPPSNSLSYALPSIRGVSSGPDVLGATTFSAIEATDQGWRILGVLWYWWLLVVAGVVATGKLFQQTYGVVRRGA